MKCLFCKILCNKKLTKIGARLRLRRNCIAVIYGCFFVFGAVMVQAGPVYWPSLTLGGAGGSYSLGIDTQSDDGAGIVASIVTGDLMQDDATMGIAFGFFETTQGDSITDSYAAGAQMLFGNEPGATGSMTLPVGGEFLLGFYFETSLPEGSPDSYGWGRFTYDGATLSLLESAAEKGEQGIIAGTYVAVPEPGSFALGVLGLLTILRRRRRLHA